MNALKEKWLECSRYRQVLLIILALAFVVSLISYCVVSRRYGLAYENTLLYPTTQGDNQIYQGKLEGEIARFSISPQGTVTYEWGGQQYGPWQITEDPSAVPQNFRNAQGIEISLGDTVVFRGCYLPSLRSLVREDGATLTDYMGTSLCSDNTLILSNPSGGPHQPGLTTLAQMVLDPQLSRRGEGELFLLAVLVSVLNGFQICFPRLLFRLSLLGRIRDPDSAEPSDFYIAMEKIEWAFLTILALLLYGISLYSIV